MYTYIHTYIHNLKLIKRINIKKYNPDPNLDNYTDSSIKDKDKNYKLKKVSEKLLDSDLLTDLVTHLKHYLDCLLGKHNFTCYQEQKDLEK